jgi:glutamate 5-kinase
MGLTQCYEKSFRRHNVCTAQILLTRNDLSSRERYLNARSILKNLLSHGVITVLNENDAVVTDDIRLGDNDTLGAFVANLTEADLLVILTDQDGLCDKDPRLHSDAKVLNWVNASDPNLDVIAHGLCGELGTGGMMTKVNAARLAAECGAFTIIANGREVDVLKRLYRGESLGTLLVPDSRQVFS